MVQTRKIIKKNMEDLMEKHKTRECSVKLIRLNLNDNSGYQKAVLRMYGIRDLRVKLHRLAATTKKKKFLAKSNVKSVRSHVPWLPTTSKTKHDLTKNPSNYQYHHEDSASTLHKAEQFNERRQRSLSLGMRPKPTNEDIHLELLEKLKEPNRSLVPVGRRTIPVFNPPPLPEWMNIFNEFQEKITERKTKQNE